MPTLPASAPVSHAPATAWTEPASYVYTLTTGCTRGFYGARYRVTVQDRRVVSNVPLDEQAERHADFQPPTLGELDDWITTQDLANEGVRRERDPVDGHPVAFGFDQKAMAYDGGSCYEVSDFAPE
jgi:hypothetical protein